MRVQIGPLPSGGVGMWIAYARTVIGQLLAHPDQLGASLPTGVAETFESYLDQWDDVAAGGPDFLWVTEVEAERVEILGKAFFTIADRLARAAEARGYPISPPEGEPFYQALVKGFLDALAQEGGSRLEFSEQLRDEWPGLKPE